MPALPEARGLVQARQRMSMALDIARETPADDVPVGAVLFGPDGDLLGTGTNRREADRDPTAHAEVVALRRAVDKFGHWRLDGCEIVVTLEPCLMCAGAIVGARVGSIVYGAAEPKTGACGSLIDAVRVPAATHVPEVRGGVLAEQCASLLTAFFAVRRPHGEL